MHRLALVIAFTLGTMGLALAQAPAAEDHSAHHPPSPSQAAPAPSDSQSGHAAQSKPQSEQESGGAAADPQMRVMMQGMMQMMQGMQGMMRMMHQQAQPEQRQTVGRAQMMQDCPMMSRAGGTPADATTMLAMMQMMQGMMQMMQSHMQSGGDHGGH